MQRRVSVLVCGLLTLGAAAATRPVAAEPAPAPRVTGLTLVDATTDRPIPGFDPIADGAVLDLAVLPAQELNIRANVSGAVGSVRFDDGRRPVRTENVAPYALAGDRDGDYAAWAPDPREHAITSTPFASAHGRGAPGASITVTFLVTSGGPPPGRDATRPVTPTVPPPAQPLPAHAVPAPSVGRIAVTADGNQHDNDDWGASPLGLAILAHRGLQTDLVHYDYNSHVWDSAKGWAEESRTGVLGAGQRFGFDTWRFFDGTDRVQTAAGTHNLVAEINRSTETDPLWLVIAGPVELPWRALTAADPGRRRFVRCLTHSRWNDEHAAAAHRGPRYHDLLALGCQEVRVGNQNNRLGVQPMANWSWLTAGGRDLLWVHSRLAAYRSGDVSDAGMLYYVATGDSQGTPSKLRSYFGL